MLAFITSLRHPHNAADYPRVEALLKTTLDSVSAQTSDDFVVLVVGNRRPAFALPERVHFVPVDFPPGSQQSGPRTPLDDFVRDKGTKIAIGLVAARQFAPDFVMIFDADDFVHNGLARFVAEHPESEGWVIDSGYMYSDARNAYRPQTAFNRVCGSCHIVAYETYGVTPHLDVHSTQDQLETAFGERMRRIIGAHRDGVEWFAQQGRELTPLPFAGAVYRVDTGENHSGKQMTGVARPLGRRMSDTFGIPRRERSAGDLWSAVGPRALAQSLNARGRAVARARHD